LERPQRAPVQGRAQPEEAPLLEPEQTEQRAQVQEPEAAQLLLGQAQLLLGQAQLLLGQAWLLLGQAWLLLAQARLA
jgi:hypothetical protein